MEAINIIAYPNDKLQTDALKAVLKALKIKFEVSNSDENTYNTEFVEKISKSQQEYNNGNYLTVEKENLNEFLGI